METIGIAELCDWLGLDHERVRRLRICRDGSRFPPPILGGAGLSWYVSDVLTWLNFLGDWKDAIAAGQDSRAALNAMVPPFYVSTEPEDRVCAKRGIIKETR